MWAVCKAFNVLPNDPLFQDLHPLQLAWIIENMAIDAREQLHAMKQRGGTDVITKEFESDEGFEELIKQHRQARNG